MFRLLPDKELTIMKRIFKFSAAILAVCTMAAVSASAQENRLYESYIEVTGNAEREIAPDLFYLKVDIDEQDSKGKKSLEKQQADMLDALKSLGVDPLQQVTRLSLYSSYYNRRKNTATASYQIKLFGAEQLTKAWSKLDELGLSNVSFQKAECSTLARVQEEVRSLAVQNAKEQASKMASAIGQTIGKCFYIYGGYMETPAVFALPRMYSKSMMADGANMAEDAPDSPLEFGKIKVSSKVTARFILE